MAYLCSFLWPQKEPEPLLWSADTRPYEWQLLQLVALVCFPITNTRSPNSALVRIDMSRIFTNHLQGWLDHECRLKPSLVRAIGDWSPEEWHLSNLISCNIPLTHVQSWAVLILAWIIGLNAMILFLSHSLYYDCMYKWYWFRISSTMQYTWCMHYMQL